MNWAEIRSRFPAIERCTYLNTAAGAPMSKYATDDARVYLDDMYAVGDLNWEDWLRRVEEVRGDTARFIGATPDEVALLSNTSMGMNLAARMLPPGEVLLVADDFPSLTLPFLQQKFLARFVAPEPDGVIPLSRIEAAIGPETRYLAVSFVQFRTGFKANLTALGELCRSRGLRLVVDSTQGTGAFPLDVARDGIDVLVFSGYKWMTAGYGIAPLFIKRDILETRDLAAVGWRSARVPYDLVEDRLDLSRRAAALEAGHPSFPGIFALGGSLRLLRELGSREIESRVTLLTDYLHQCLDQAGVPIRSPRAKEHRSAITMVAVADPPLVARRLKERNVFVSARGKGLRVSTHFYNNHEDVDRFVAELQPIIAD